MGNNIWRKERNKGWWNDKSDRPVQKSEQHFLRFGTSMTDVCAGADERDGKPDVAIIVQCIPLQPQQQDYFEL